MYVFELSEQRLCATGMLRSAAGGGRLETDELSSSARIADRSPALSPSAPPYSLLRSSGKSQTSLRISKRTTDSLLDEQN